MLCEKFLLSENTMIYASLINYTPKHTWVCACTCAYDCTRLREQHVDFWKVIYENVEKKFHKHIYIIWVAEILKFYEVLFCTYRKGLFCLLKTVVMLIFLRISTKHSQH